MKPANFVRVATHLEAVSYAAPGHASASDATANCQYVLQQGKGTNATTTDFTQMNASRWQHILLAIQHVISSKHYVHDNDLVSYGWHCPKHTWPAANM